MKIPYEPMNHCLAGILLAITFNSSFAQQFEAQTYKKPEKGIHTSIFELLVDQEQLTTYDFKEPVPLSYYSDKQIAAQEVMNANEQTVITYQHNKASKATWTEIDNEEITPYTWKWVYLTLTNSHGEFSAMSLRRPNWWLKKWHLDHVDNLVYLDAGELGAKGWAKVIAIWPNQFDSRVIQSKGSESQPVIGKFERESNNVIKLIFSEGEEAKVTGEHLIWSESRDGWVEAGSLYVGEEIRTYSGTSKLLGVDRLHGQHKVYNIEVYRDHNYFASQQKILAHNGPVCGIDIRSVYWRNLEDAAYNSPDRPVSKFYRAAYVGEKIEESYNLVLYYIAKNKRDMITPDGAFSDAIEKIFYKAKSSGAKRLNFVVSTVINPKVRAYLENMSVKWNGIIDSGKEGKNFLFVIDLEELRRIYPE